MIGRNDILRALTDGKTLTAHAIAGRLAGTGPYISGRRIALALTAMRKAGLVEHVTDAFTQYSGWRITALGQRHLGTTQDG